MPDFYTPVLPSPLKVGDYVGPRIGRTSGPRDQFQHPLNETCSLRDPVHWEQVYNVVVRELARLKQPRELIADYREPITEAIHRRVAIMFQQLVVCYNTGLHFELGWTSHQAKSAPALKVKTRSGEHKICTRNAAHSSTIPCLNAYEGAAWDSYAQGRGTRPQGFVYMRNADTFRWWNSTINMPRDVNEADREIDEKTNDSTLRKDALAILNRAAKGEITPEQGLMLFLDTAAAVTARRHRVVTKPGIKEALSYYVEDLADIKDGLVFDPTQFDQLLDVQVDGSEEAANLRSMVYRLRFQAIRWAHLEQSKLLQKVEALRAEVLGTGRKPTYFDAAFRHLLIEVMPTPADRKRIMKLYNLPNPRSFRQTVARKSTYDSTKQKVQGHLARIQFVGKELSLAMRRLRVEEEQRRGGVLKAVRNEAGLSQARFGSKLKAQFPNTPASQSTISRSETGVRIVTQEYAKQLSKVLKIDPACFMPQFWFSGV